MLARWRLRNNSNLGRIRVCEHIIGHVWDNNILSNVRLRAEYAVCFYAKFKIETEFLVTVPNWCWPGGHEGRLALLDSRIKFLIPCWVYFVTAARKKKKNKTQKRKKKETVFEWIPPTQILSRHQTEQDWDGCLFDRDRQTERERDGERERTQIPQTQHTYTKSYRYQSSVDEKKKRTSIWNQKINTETEEWTDKRDEIPSHRFRNSLLQCRIIFQTSINRLFQLSLTRSFR